MTKKTKTSGYIAKLDKIYANIPDKNRDKADELIKRLAEVLDMMDDCVTRVDAEGVITKMDQGKYAIDRINPAVAAYNQLHKSMLATVEKLNKMQPDDAGSDELEEFLNRRI